MYQGVINENNFEDLLRGFANKRKNGIAEITLLEAAIKLYFVNGKMLDIIQEGLNPLDGLTEILFEAGLIPEDFIVTDQKTYKQLFLSIKQFGVTEEQLKFAVKHRILETFFLMDYTQSSGIYTFKVEVPSLEKEFLPQISVTQLLIEIAGKQEASAIFEKHLDNDNVWLEIVNKEYSAANENEEMILGALKQETLQGIDVKRKSMLCTFYFRKTILELIRKEAIKLSDSPVTVNQAIELPDEIPGSTDPIGKETQTIEKGSFESGPAVEYSAPPPDYKNLNGVSHTIPEPSIGIFSKQGPEGKPKKPFFWGFARKNFQKSPAVETLNKENKIPEAKKRKTVQKKDSPSDFNKKPEFKKSLEVISQISGFLFFIVALLLPLFLW